MATTTGSSSSDSSPSTPSVASCGWTPTVAHTPGPAVCATSMAFLDSSASVPIVTIRVTPWARASSTATRPTPSYWTWQCESAQGTGRLSLLAREQRGPLLDGQTAGIATPPGGGRQALFGHRAGQAQAPPQL